MPTAETLSTFFVLALVLGFTPGPDNLFVLVQAMTQGPRAGFAVVAGLCSGLVLHTLLLAAGLAAVFATSALAFAVVKWLGAAYLAWLAWQAWREADAPLEATSPPPRTPSRRLYGRGVLMNLGNPKVVLFFLALLPQFVDAGRGPVAGQLLLLGLVFILATVLAFGTITVLAGRIGKRLRRSVRAQRWLRRSAALVFAGLAVRLAVATR